MGKYKPLSEANGHLTKVTQIAKAQQEDTISDLDRMLLEDPPDELRDAYAKKTWKRILPDLLQLPVLCNLDRDALIGYCNAWSEYVESVEMAKRILASDVPDMKLLESWWRKEEKAQDAQRKFGALCGMSIDSRLKMAATKMKKEAERVDEKFGVI